MNLINEPFMVVSKALYIKGLPLTVVHSAEEGYSIVVKNPILQKIFYPQLELKSPPVV